MFKRWWFWILIFFFILLIVPKDEEKQPESGGSGKASDSLQLGDVPISLKAHPVKNGTGTETLFDIGVGKIEKSDAQKASSDQFNQFLDSLDFTDFHGTIVLEFEDGTGLVFSEGTKNVSADYGALDLSEGNFTITQRLGAAWNDADQGWYYMTVEEMRQKDEAQQPLETAPEETQVSMDALSSMIKATLDQNFAGNSVSIEGNTVTVNLWNDGVVAALQAIQADGGGADHPDWVALKDGMSTLSSSIQALIDTCGYPDVNLIINVLNDQNHDNTLLSLLEGQVVYDVLAQ